MINFRPLPLCAFASAFLFSALSVAQQAAPAAARIVNPIDESQLVTLSHTVHPLANAVNDRGAAPEGMQLDRLQLVLKRSPSQETALRSLIAQMQTPGSPSYHQWLTPDQFGAQFGAADQDITTIETWLASHGFSVSKVNPGKGTIEFSGNVAQLRDTFHTQIHKYVVNGENHFANANDPQIPAALAPVIGGFASLNNFRPKSYLQKLGKASFNPATHQVSPSWTWGSTPSTSYYVLAPGDFSKQYDLTPLYNNNINGTGQSIAIINDSNININFVNQFRTLFGLPANPPQVIIDGNDPGVDGTNNPDGPNYDSFEAYLDVEWSGAVAPNATIDLVIAADTSLETGLILAMEHAVDGDVAPVVSISFGQCESALGADNAFIEGLWEQAAAQGQTISVAAGDNGSAGCDDDNSEDYAVDGQNVNGYASTPFNVAVGGTDFYYSDYNGTSTALAAQLATYWNPNPTQTPSVSLLQYIPEQPWNDSQYGLNIYNQLTATGTSSIAGGSGGASNAAICPGNSYSATTGACTVAPTGYAKPSWQSGTGVPSDNVRDLPDVSLFSANAFNYSFYPICAVDGDCQAPSGSNLVQISGVGGTSASAPSFAGIMALVVEQNGRQGQADTILYPLKAQYPAAFHDITVGTNSVPCEYSPTASLNCISVSSPADVNGVTEGEIGTGTTPDYNAAAGYNLATGLGSIDAYNLVTDWSKIKLTTTTTTLSPSSTSFAHGTPITITGSVTAGSGTPTGDVALMTDSSEPLQQGQAFFTLSGGSYTSATQYPSGINFLPGGTYHIWGQYGGDGSNAMSTSTPPVQITVTPETPGMNFNLFNSAAGVYYTSSSNPGTSIEYGMQLMLSSEVAPTSQLSNLQNCTINGTNCSSLSYTQPTGTVTFTDNSNAINTAVVNAEGDAEYNAPFAVGTHSVSATYNGDQSYNKVSATSPIPFTVIKDTPDFFWAASNVNNNSQIINGQATAFNVIVENDAQYSTYYNSNGGAIAPVPVLPPTGTVTLSSSPAGISGVATLSAGVDPATGAQSGTGVITLPSTIAAGNYNVTFSYSGDSNYNGCCSPAATTTITVVATTGLQASTTAATMTGSVSPNTSISITGTVTGVIGHPAPTGGIIIFSSGNDIGEIAVSPGSGLVSTFSLVLNSQALFQGANFVTLQYTGDTNYAPSAATLNSGNAINSPLSDFSLVPSTTIVPVSLTSGAGSGTDTINATSVNGFSGTVSLTCKAAAPVTCTISPNPALSNGSSTTSTLTINVPAGTANGNYNVIVTGSDPSGEYVHTLAVTADVSGSTPGFTLSNSGAITIAQGATTNNTSTITVTPGGGFTGSVALTCAVTTAPAGATDPTCSIASPANIISAGAVAETLAITSSASTTAGSYIVTVTGTSGSLTSSTPVNVTVNLPQDFSMSNSGNITVNAGATSGNTSTISATPTSSGFTGTVVLSCAITTAPPGATNPLTCGNSNLNPTSVALSGTTAQTSVLTITSSSSTTPGAYVATVTGTAGSDVHTTTVNVTVNAAATPTYTVSATSPSSAISPGSSATSTVTVSAGTTGYAGSVSLTCALTNSPTGASDLPSCSITTGSPVALSSGTTSGTATATVTSTAATADLVRPNFGKGKGWLGAGSGALLALLVFFGIPARRRSWRSMLGILILLAALGGLSSCGGGSSSSGGSTGPPSNPGTTAGQYTFTVTSSGTPSVSPAPTTTFTVSVN